MLEHENEFGEEFVVLVFISAGGKTAVYRHGFGIR